MSTGADLASLARLAADLRETQQQLRVVERDVSGALADLARSSSHFVPSWPSHAGALSALDGHVDELWRQVDRTAHELARADDVLWRRWVPGHDEYGVHDGWASTVQETLGFAPAPVQDALTAWTAHDVVTMGPLLSDTLRDAAAGTRSATTHAWMQRTHARYTDAVGRAVNGLWTRLPGARVPLVQPAAVTRTVSTVRSVLSRPAVGNVMAGAGVVLGGWRAVDGVRAGDSREVWLGTTQAAASALMFAGPAGAAAGTVILVGVAVYENWDTITDVAGRAAGAVSDAAGAVGDAISDAGAALGEAVSDVGGALRDRAASMFSGLFGGD